MKRLMLLLALIASPCTAQEREAETVEIGSLYYTNVLQSGLMEVSRPSMAAAQRSVLGEPLPTYNAIVAKAELRYQTSEGISRTLRQKLASRAVASNPSQAYGIRRALATDAIWLNFDKVLSTYGFSSANLADVMASYYVRCWEMVNGTDAHPVFMRAARNRLYWMLTYSPEIILMSDTEKQRTAETLGILTSVVQSGRDEMRKQGDQVGMGLMQNAVHKSLLIQGVDLKQLTLTSRGFAPVKPVVVPPLAANAPVATTVTATTASTPAVVAPQPPLVVAPTTTAAASADPKTASETTTGPAPYPAYVQYQAMLKARAAAAQASSAQ